VFGHFILVISAFWISVPSIFSTGDPQGAIAILPEKKYGQPATRDDDHRLDNDIKTSKQTNKQTKKLTRKQ